MRDYYRYAITMRLVLFHAICFGKFVFTHKFLFQDDFFDASANSANKIASVILGNKVSHSSLGTGISLSSAINNHLTHEQGKQYEYELSLAETEKEHKVVIQKWKAIDEK